MSDGHVAFTRRACSGIGASGTDTKTTALATMRQNTQHYSIWSVAARKMVVVGCRTLAGQNCAQRPDLLAQSHAWGMHSVC